MELEVLRFVMIQFFRATVICVRLQELQIVRLPLLAMWEHSWIIIV
jgi:hypothetical protein